MSLLFKKFLRKKESYNRKSNSLFIFICMNKRYLIILFVTRFALQSVLLIVLSSLNQNSWINIEEFIFIKKLEVHVINIALVYQNRTDIEYPVKVEPIDNQNLDIVLSLIV